MSDEDWALKEINLDWEDGGAYALLGSSGCGKTTMLNLISGLLTPTEGSISFDGKDITAEGAETRNIAQVFQFPVVYDTMTVRENLAFPLKNRGYAKKDIDNRVETIAAMLDLKATLDKRAAGLTADGKQKISLGRGLVRPDVNAVLFDEPLTVIDPHLKWQLRSKLKDLHQQFGTTMIYVTHDQTEALTFADKVVVMHDGMVVQIGTPVELFDAPQHTFVGHFIGSPGMNILPGKWKWNTPVYDRFPVNADANNRDKSLSESIAPDFQYGVRPEFVYFADRGIPVSVDKVHDIGRARIVETSHHNDVIRLVVPGDTPIPERHGHIRFVKEKTAIFVNGWRYRASHTKVASTRHSDTDSSHHYGESKGKSKGKSQSQGAGQRQ